MCWIASINKNSVCSPCRVDIAICRLNVILGQYCTTQLMIPELVSMFLSYFVIVVELHWERSSLVGRPLTFIALFVFFQDICSIF